MEINRIKKHMTNVKFSSDLLFRPLDENCVGRKCVKESTYLAG